MMIGICILGLNMGYLTNLIEKKCSKLKINKDI